MGSLFAALTTAVSGLNAQSSAIGNISENLANAQTTGYKSVGTEFEQLVNASNATINNPGGVTATPQYQNDVQGSIVSSNTATSLAISGDGYFAVESATTSATGVFTPGNAYYTRQGDFTLDKNGYLVNGSGYYLTGYGITSDGVVNTSSTSAIQISALLNNPVAATSVDYSANLPSNAAVGYTAPASTLSVYDSLGNSHDVNYTWTKTGTNSWDLNVSVPSATDTNGNPYSATIPFSFNDGTNGTTSGTIGGISANVTSTPDMTISSAPNGTFSIGNVSVPWTDTGLLDGTATSVAVTVGGVSKTVNVSGLSTDGDASAYATNMAAVLNAVQAANYSTSNLPSSFVATANANSAGELSLSQTTLSIQPNANGNAGQVAWADATDGTTAEQISDSAYSPPLSSVIGALASVSVQLKFQGTDTQTVALNFGTIGGSTGVTQFSDTAGTVSVSNFSQNGLPKGSFNSVSIASNGDVTLNYSNGTNKTIAQIPVATFYAQDQLQQVSGGAYTATLASGNAKLYAPGVNGAGTLSANSLEESNVDISTQFTNLIQAQQVYTANAKVVTTDNSLLQVTLNMIQ